MEYIDGGSLDTLIKSLGCFPESVVAIYVRQMLAGLEYLHGQGVIHRDIKGGNILTTRDGVVKLADFGVATKLAEDGEARANTFAGTPYWAAPEVIEMQGTASRSARDIWSLGCTVFELLKGRPPNFDCNNALAAMTKIVREPMPLPEGVSAECRAFLAECFTKDPTLRPDARALLAHPWLARSAADAGTLSALLSSQQLPGPVTNTIKTHFKHESAVQRQFQAQQ